MLKAAAHSVNANTFCHMNLEDIWGHEWKLVFHSKCFSRRLGVGRDVNRMPEIQYGHEKKITTAW